MLARFIDVYTISLVDTVSLKRFCFFSGEYKQFERDKMLLVTWATGKAYYQDLIALILLMVRSYT